MSSMRFDMGGAAAVAGAMKLLSETKAKVNVVALTPIVENMPDNTSVIPGDVIRYKNGLYVQVGNTDAEGRLILADGLIRAGETQCSIRNRHCYINRCYYECPWNKACRCFW